MKSLIAALILLGMSAAAWADGLIVDPRHQRPVADLFTVKNHLVTVSIDDQHAVTEIDQNIRNISGRMAEAVYLFPVPRDAQISGLEMWIGERKVDGEILPADKARSIYNEIVRSKRDPALLEYVGSGVYRTSVFPFAPDEEKHLRIRYTELLRKDSGLVRYLYPLNTEKFSKYPLEEARVEVSLKSRGKIKTLYSPTHPLSITRGSESAARASWSVRKDIPRTDFELYYSTDDAEVGASLLTYRPDPAAPGYFLFLASPRVETGGRVEPKDIVFVLDKSGSMRADNKIAQAREALTYCLRSLNAGDRFGIISFNDRVDKYAEKLVPFNEQEKEKAAAHVFGIEATSGTNINEALTSALGLFEAGERLKMVVFLTDGLPTVGVTEVGAIVKNAGAANAAKVRVFTFGVGYDVNTTLLDRIARENRGESEYVKPQENLETRISGFYGKVQSPVLSDLKIEWGGMGVKETLPRQVPDLFRGGQVILSGRYEGSGPTRIAVTGTALGREQRYEFEVSAEGRSEGTGKLFVERLWAQRQIGNLLDQIQLYGKSQELVDEVVRLSMKYGIITPYTSFLVREDMALGNRQAQNEEFEKKVRVFNAPGGVRPFAAAEERGRLSKPAAPAPTGATTYRDEEGKEVRATTVQTIGRRTFYRRAGVWQEADTPANLEAVTVKYYSDEFFKLLEENDELNSIAVLDADVIVRIGEKLYRLSK
jgi:Ca-activated chloride channel family protein